MNPLDGMTPQERQSLVVHAQLVRTMARMMVLQDLVVTLYKRAGFQAPQHLSLEEYIRLQTKSLIPTALAAMADFQPGYATKLAKVIEAMDEKNSGGEKT